MKLFPQLGVEMTVPDVICLYSIPFAHVEKGNNNYFLLISVVSKSKSIMMIVL